MSFPSLLGLPVAALMAFTPLSAQAPDSGSQAINGDRFLVDQYVYKDGDTTNKVQVYEVTEDLPEHAVMYFSGETISIGDDLTK